MKCVWVWLGAGYGVCSEWVTGLGLGFTNHVGTGVVCDMCLCLGCGGVDGVGGLLGPGSGRMGCYCVYCKSGFFVEMASPGICVLCSADTRASYVHPVFNPVAH